MSRDTEISTRLDDLNKHHQRHHYHHDKTPVSELNDDECSVDSGCSSSSCTGSSLSCRNSDEQSDDRPNRSRRIHCYLERLQMIDRSTWSQDRNGNAKKSSELAGNMKNVRSLSRNSISLRRYSFNPSDVQDDRDSAKKYSTIEILKRTFQSLKISSIKWNDQERKNAKKSPKRILRSPVSYIYVRGLSGLPTQRVPRNAVLQQKHSYSYQDLIRLYR